MARSSDRKAHAEHVETFKEDLKDVLTQRRALGIKSTLIQRLEVKKGIRRSLDLKHMLE